MLPRKDKLARYHVVTWSCDANRNIIGMAHINPVLDNRMYQVKFAAGDVSERTKNIIAFSIHAQCNANVNEYLILDAPVDYCKDNKAISLKEQQTSIQGRPVTCKTTADWHICCQLEDSSTSWEKLSKLKESFPVQKAEIAVAQEFDHESAFIW